MKYFTPQEMHPSEKTLHIIRQVARLYTEARYGSKHGLTAWMS